MCTGVGGPNFRIFFVSESDHLFKDATLTTTELSSLLPSSLSRTATRYAHILMLNQLELLYQHHSMPF